MPFKRYVEIGRVAMVNYGEEYGKLLVISDVVDHNRCACSRQVKFCHRRHGHTAMHPTSHRRALVDAPDYTRKIVSFRRLSLTDLKVDIPRLASKKVLSAKLAESGKPSSSQENRSAACALRLIDWARVDLSDRSMIIML